MLDQYGKTEESFIGKTPNDFFSNDVKRGRDIWRKLFDSGKLHIETDEKKADGTPIKIEGDYICLYNGLGQIIGHFGCQEDITEKTLQNRNSKNP
jgi:PAS domain-containing protein